MNLLLILFLLCTNHNKNLNNYKKKFMHKLIEIERNQAHCSGYQLLFLLVRNVEFPLFPQLKISKNSRHHVKLLKIY